MKSRTAQLLSEVKASNQDFEWYPTTDEIIHLVSSDIDNFSSHEKPSVLDCGAGDGRVLKALNASRRYAIEKSKPLLNALDRNIFVVGTEFEQQTLLDKKVDVIFSNPPYAEYVQWAVKIIREANAKVIYLVIPSRWESNELINEAIKKREAKTTILGQFDFLGADRTARAKVDVLKIDLSFSGYGYRRTAKTDPFKLWFEEHFKIEIAKSERSKYDLSKKASDSLQEATNNALVKGDNIVPVLEELYKRDLDKLVKTYKQLEDIDPGLLEEMDINLKSVREALQQKVSGLKDLYWKELFDNLDKVTNKLSTKSRKRLLETLTAHTHIDFTVSNAYAVVIWVIKNANQYFDDQLIELVETMTEKANVSSYVSNRKTFGDEGWYYGRANDKLVKYKLEHRIVLARVGGINESTWRGDAINGLSMRAIEYLNDLCTVASNIGFDTKDYSGASSMTWKSGKKHSFHYFDYTTGEPKVLFEVKAFKNGNLHLKLNQAFICKLNVEFGRLKGWIKSPKHAAEELEISVSDAVSSFDTNLCLVPSNILSLDFKRAA